jgi:hypothetical protein
LVAFDSVGPAGGAGAGNFTAGTITWTHTVVAGPAALTVGATLGLASGSDAALTMAATCDGVAMTPGPAVHSNNAALGFLQTFTALGLATGAHTIVVTVSGGAVASMACGSIAFSAAGAFGTPATAASTGATASVAVPANTNGNLIAAFTGDGSGAEVVGGTGTKRFLIDQTSSTGCGNCMGWTAPATGSSVTLTATMTSDFWAVIAFEVLPATATAIPDLAMATRIAP